MKTFRKATSEMEIPTLRHGNFHKIWNLKWKLWEIETFRKLKSEKETLRAEHHQKKCICSQINIVLKWNFQHSDMNTWIRSQHKQKSFRMKFLIVLPQPKAHAKPLRPESCSPIFPPKKTWNLNCDLGAPLFEDVWTMFEWQNVEGFFQVFILKRMGPYWCQVHAPSSSNAPPIIPNPSQFQNVKGHVKKLYTIFSRGCFKPQFSILESKSVSLGKNHAYWILDWMGLSNLSCRFKPARLFHHKAFED